MKKNSILKYLSIFLMTVIIFGLGNEVRALESTPEYCFKYAAYPTEDCHEIIECSEIDGEKICGPVCEGLGIYVDFYIEDYLCYDGNDKGYETITDVVIPTIFEGLDLTKINHHMSIDGFQNKNLTSVVIPNVVNKIEEEAFYNNELVELIIPSSIAEIGKLAFANNKITTIINNSSISNEVLNDNIGSSDKNTLVFGTNCKKLGDGITTCVGENVDDKTNESNQPSNDDKINEGNNTSNVDKNNESNKPSNDDKYNEDDKNYDNSSNIPNSSLENSSDDTINNPKTLDSNIQIFILVVIFSLVVIISMLLKLKKTKYTKDSN